MWTADGKTALGRWHLFAQLARHGQFHEWETGVYENEYRNETTASGRSAGCTCIPTMITPYEAGLGQGIAAGLALRTRR